MTHPARRWLGSLAAVAVLATGCGGSQSSGPPKVVEIQIGEPVPDANAPVARARTHFVEQGETLGEIAFAYGLSYTDLALWNNIPNPDLIEVGQALQLYPPKNQPEVSIVRKVERKTPVAMSKAAATASRAQVTRTRVSVEAKRRTTVNGRTTAPIALKLDYTQEAHAALLNQATGGAEPASLKLGGDSAAGVVPRNVRGVNGISWSWPVNGKLIERFSDANRGIDIGGPRGQPIHAAADGKIIYAGSGLKGYGQLVIIKHANEYLSTYAHNDRISVAEGETIKRGSKIAEMGDSGSDRIGLHFGIRRGEEAYNPQQFLPQTP